MLKEVKDVSVSLTYIDYRNSVVYIISCIRVSMYAQMHMLFVLQLTVQELWCGNSCHRRKL